MGLAGEACSSHGVAGVRVLPMGSRRCLFFPRSGEWASGEVMGKDSKKTNFRVLYSMNAIDNGKNKTPGIIVFPLNQTIITFFSRDQGIMFFLRVPSTLKVFRRESRSFHG